MPIDERCAEQPVDRERERVSVTLLEELGASTGEARATFGEARDFLDTRFRLAKESTEEGDRSIPLRL